MKNAPKILIAIPVYNEEQELEKNVLKVKDFIEQLDEKNFQIIIVDNASTDKTREIGKNLAQEYQKINFLRLEEKGRGRAIKSAWIKDKADVYVYMDLDLSTDLRHLPAIIKAVTGGFDIAIGSRLSSKSKVIGRTIKREVLSRGYNLMIKLLFQINFSDAQCGFKAVNRRVVGELLPKILDNEWFFDTELLIVGEKSGYKIHEEPVIWTDNPGSTVRVLKTVSGDLKGLLRLFLTRPWR